MTPKRQHPDLALAGESTGALAELVWTVMPALPTCCEPCADLRQKPEAQKTHSPGQAMTTEVNFSP